MGTQAPAQHLRTATPATRAPALPEYRLIGKKGEGTFSEVLKAQCIKNGKYVAIKCMKNHFDSLEQVPPCPIRPGPALPAEPIRHGAPTPNPALAAAAAGEQPARDPGAEATFAAPGHHQAV